MQGVWGGEQWYEKGRCWQNSGSEVQRMITTVYYNEQNAEKMQGFYYYPLAGQLVLTTLHTLYIIQAKQLPVYKQQNLKFLN